MNFSKVSIRSKLLLGNVITAILLVLFCGIVWNTLNTLNSTSEMVTRTYKVIDSANGLVSAMVDQETGLRGFSVGGQDDYLEPYIEGQKRFFIYLNEAKDLTDNNMMQQKRLDGVASTAANWHAYAERIVKIRRDIRKGEKTNNDLHALIDSGIGKQKMDNLRHEILKGHFQKTGVDLLTAMLNMETGLRGFMLNRGEGYLAPYYGGKRSALNLLSSIQGSELATNAANWIDNYAEKAIALTRKANHFKSRKVLYKELSKHQGKHYMDRIRLKISTIIDEEKRLMQEYTAAASEASSLGYTVIVTGGLLVILFSFLLGFAISNSIRPHKKR